MSSSHHKILRKITKLDERIENLMTRDDEILESLKEIRHELRELLQNQIPDFECDDE